MEKPKTLQQAITKVLKEHLGEGMDAPKILDGILERDWWKPKGETPISSVRHRLGVGLRGDNPLYLKTKTETENTLYRWNSEHKDRTDDVAQQESSETADESRLIQAFGLFWDRDKFQRNNPPKLWGHQDGEERFDFCDQQGVYILYYYSKLVYVGRTQGLGKRLKDHIKDHLKDQWNWFSWFSTSDLGDVKKGDDAPSDRKQLPESATIADLEGLLIEIANPLQNGKRGDGMAEIEWKQA